jgi:hypothetical protein
LAEAELVEKDHQCHQFRQAQLALPLALFHAVGEQPFMEGGFERAAKIVNQAESFGQRVHGCLLFALLNKKLAFLKLNALLGK